MATDLRDVKKMTDAEKQVEMQVDAQRRAQNCVVDIKNALERWGCMMDPKIQISTAGIKAAWGIIPTIKVETGKS